MRIQRLDDGDFLVHIDCDLRTISERRLFVTVDKNGMPLHPEVMPLVVKIARAQKMLEMLMSGQFKSREEIAESLGFSRSTAAKIVSVAFLSPEIVRRVVKGTLPTNRVQKLLERINNVPLWADQHAFLGIE